MTSPLTRLTNQWRNEAKLLRKRGAPNSATAVESCADELEVAQREWELETLPIRDAADECGKSASQLRRDVQAGKLVVVNDEGPMKVRRSDVLELRPRRGNT